MASLVSAVGLPRVILGNTASPTAPFVTQEVAPGIHFRRGADADASALNADAIANIGFVIGEQSVAVIDPGGSLIDGQRLLARIRTLTPLPIAYVIMTHAHPDHFFGAAAFQDERPAYVAHANMPQALAARAEYYQKRLVEMLGQRAVGSIVVPSRLISGGDTLDLGRRQLTLTAHPPAHSDCDLSVYDEGTGTLMTGDLLFVERIPSLDGSLKGWLQVMNTLEHRSARRAVPGHGPLSVAWPAGGATQKRYLTTVLEETRSAIRRGLDISEAVKSVGLRERSRWVLFDDYHGHNVTRAFKELEWE
jgi:quinoprotein relay system zinc metallohydrolase 2